MRNKALGLGLAGGLAAFFALSSSQSAAAYTSALDRSVTKSLRWVSPLEWPAKAACLVSATDWKNRQEMADAVLRVTAQWRPAALPAVLGSLIRAMPASLADDLAVEACKLAPGELNLIAKAAIDAAPSCKQQILWSLGVKYPRWQCPSWVTWQWEHNKDHDKDHDKDHNKGGHENECDHHKGHYECPC